MDSNRILELVDLHAVPQAHPRRPRGQDREPPVRRRRGAAQGLAQDHLVDERGAVSARVAPGDHPVASAHDGAVLGHAEAVAELGQRRLHGIDDAVGEVRGGE